MIPQFDIIKRIPNVFNLCSIEYPGVEADDLSPAYSEKAKKMGIAMGVPWFKTKKDFLKHGGVFFSSNFALYGDISNRVMNILAGMAVNIEIYSVDEPFLD